MKVSEKLRATPMRRRQAALAVLRSWLAAETDRRFLWMPVLIAVGLSVYYSLAAEPSLSIVLAVSAGALFVAGGLAHAGRTGAAFSIALLVFGFVLGKARTEILATPVLTSDTGVVTVSGWVEEAEVKSERRQRILLRVTALEPADTIPRRLRITLPRSSGDLDVGLAVSFKARLFAPNRPVAPGAFDFARRNWFLGIGGSGFGFGEISEPHSPGERPIALSMQELISTIRNGIAASVESHLDGEQGAYAIAVLTGMRDRLSETTVEALRSAGLAHLLAISGLHMGLVAFTLFGLVRGVLALHPRLALHYPIKKWAAAVALGGGAVYLAISGASVSTQRAYIMVAIMFVAIMVERPAISMRNVALAALVILCLKPESVLSAGFQMSFLAVTALVALYEQRERFRSRLPLAARSGGVMQRFAGLCVLYFGGIVLSTLVAGLATAPMAAYHFHRVAVLGAVANLIAIPLMGLVIMPIALIGILLAPMGLEGLPLWLAGHGISWLLDTAHFAAGLPGAMRHVPSVGMPAFGLIVAGILWLCLWRSPLRLAGIGLAAGGILLGALNSQPDVLIEENAKLIAVRTDAGVLVPSTASKARFVNERWLSMDGDSMPLTRAAARKGFSCDGQGCLVQARGGRQVALVLVAPALWDACRTADIVITAFSFRGPCGSAGAVIDRYALYKHGAHALYFEADGVSVRRVADERGARPWSGYEGAEQ